MQALFYPRKKLAIIKYPIKKWKMSLFASFLSSDSKSLALLFLNVGSNEFFYNLQIAARSFPWLKCVQQRVQSSTNLLINWFPCVMQFLINTAFFFFSLQYMLQWILRVLKEKYRYIVECAGGGFFFSFCEVPKTSKPFVVERAQITVKAGRFPDSSVHCLFLLEDQQRVLQRSGPFRWSLRNGLKCPKSSAGSSCPFFLCLVPWEWVENISVTAGENK